MEFEILNLSHGNSRSISTSKDAPISFFFIFDSQELTYMYLLGSNCIFVIATGYFKECYPQDYHCHGDLLPMIAVPEYLAR